MAANAGWWIRVGRDPAGITHPTIGLSCSHNDRQRFLPSQDTRRGRVCRVDQGDHSPRPPTDPDVRDYRIRLLESRMHHVVTCPNSV